MNNNSRLSKEEVVDTFTNMLLRETVKMIDTQPHKEEIYAHFMTKVLGLMVYRSLMSKPSKPASAEALFEYTSNNFKKMKVLAQECISAAFSGAMSTYTGKEVEYYCLVKTVGDPVNKEMI